MVVRSPFGQWLRHRRKLLDLTQAGLARQVACSAITIRKLEAGERRPSRELAGVLAAALHVPDRERKAFVHFARSDDITPSFHLPAWEPEQPSWRALQLPGTVPEVSADVEGLTLDYDLVAPEAPNYKKSDDGRLLAIVRAHGPLRGEMEGTLELHITQVIVPKPPNMDISRALPMHIGTLFKIHSGDDALEGSYTGTMYPMLDASGTGTARVQGTGQVISVSTGFIDLFLYYVFVEDVVKMVEGTGTGARGPMMLKSGT